MEIKLPKKDGDKKQPGFQLTANGLVQLTIEGNDRIARGSDSVAHVMYKRPESRGFVRFSTDCPPELRGNKFIGFGKTFTDPRDGAFGDSIPRDCDFCFYRAYSANPDGDCHITDESAKKDFGVGRKFLPKEFDGVRTGHYCKRFVDFRSE